MLWTFRIFDLIGQTALSGTLTKPGTASPPRPMSFSDLQQGLRAQLNGQTNDWHYRHLLLWIIVVVVLFGIFLHLRQRRKSGGPPNSSGRLRWELSRGVPFPLGSKMMLWWVARSARVPVAALLISAQVFETSVQEWRGQQTFTPLRRWGGLRLSRLHEVLFETADPEPRPRA